ncbi:MAG: hypothetical protein GW762_05370 [Candidatus Pacebacteria bacterium]|nr:hypothetical protein [Candidatus Paceibacterota bacterium]PIR63831.1 MAG: hypothetical protein COU64_02575 [Candidatus Pacebacteria bacterium CG10_big_fil_rev_8_21_14_0_10_40_26]PIZ78803.1 MAG: hypothetical protein COY01_03325 [Candidatus Pacebacteria bacterium CG_4_10_14_0_2_um_filter_40_20]PJA68786.1 MAG: hypothetical protein CO156_03580 [Candidatus Pacebacteria bacterium CG_4_9_14_3_um_filter_40_12]PJC41163.1 MAG: hypothetical protein CO041_06065 [Candidatus Pacebacteria bacterium CG_4_9_
MQILFQIKNLLYATIFSSLEHITHFPPLFLMASVVVLFFTGVALLVLQKKQSYLLFSYYYLSIAAFIIIVDLLARLHISYISAIFSVSFLFLLMSVGGFWHRRKLLLEWVQNIKKSRLQYVVLATLVVTSTFFFSKFIYDNGLHDEYQHHAVVEDMLWTEYWPIRDEVKYGVELSDYYHYGWYYIVILVKVVFSFSTEVALDLTKIALFIPMLPVFFSLSRKFLKWHWMQSLTLAILLLLQGPALFLLDAYTGNVFFSRGNNIIYEPLFFQLAGITWFGIVFMVAFLAIGYQSLQNKQLWKVVFFALISMWSLFLLNKAYLLVHVPSLLFFALYINRDTIFHVLKKRKKLFVSLTLIGLMVLGIVIINIFHFSPLLLTKLKGESGVPFIRATAEWGFPFTSMEGLKFQSMLSLGSLRAFGLFPILSILFLSVNVFQKKEKSISFMLVLYWIFLWCIPVVLNFSGWELALNKFYIPAMWLSTLIVIDIVSRSSEKIKIIFNILTITSCIATSLYFSSLSFSKTQNYWDYNDQIIDYLYPENEIINIYMDSEDSEYAKRIMNALHVQLVFDGFGVSQDDELIMYQISRDKYDNLEMVARTDTHYLYKK